MLHKVQDLIDHCTSFAKEAIEEVKEFYPIAAYQTNNNKIYPIDFVVDKKNIPNNGEVISRLTEQCEIIKHHQDIEAYAIAYEVKVQLDSGENKDCICIDIQHQNLKEMPLLYYPFEVKNNKLYYEDLFAVKRK